MSQIFVMRDSPFASDFCVNSVSTYARLTKVGQRSTANWNFLQVLHPLRKVLPGFTVAGRCRRPWPRLI